MDTLNALLRVETLTLLAVFLSLAIIFRNLIMLTRNRPALDHQLARIDAELGDHEKILNDLVRTAEQEEADRQDGKREIKTKTRKSTKKRD